MPLICFGYLLLYDKVPSQLHKLRQYHVSIFPVSVDWLGLSSTPFCVDWGPLGALLVWNIQDGSFICLEVDVAVSWRLTGLLTIPTEFFMWPLHVTWQLGSERKCSQYSKRKEAKLLVLLRPGLEVPELRFTCSPGQSSHMASADTRARELASPLKEWHV